MVIRFVLFLESQLHLLLVRVCDLEVEINWLLYRLDGTIRIPMHQTAGAILTSCPIVG